jgi:hypothetical protein
MPSIPPHAVVVSDASFAAADPDAIVQSNHAYVNALLDDYLTPDEIAPDALRSYYVDFYATQVGGGGFDGFARAGGWHPSCARAVREGLEAIGATRHLALFEEAARRFEAGTPIDLDDAFDEVARREDLNALHSTWLRGLPHLVVLPVEVVRAEAIRRAGEVPPERLPREVRLIRALCARAGHRYLHLSVDRFTDHARFVGVWHFVTDRGHHHMIEQGGKALMRSGDETLCEVDAPPDD